MQEVRATYDEFKSYHRNHYFLDLNDAWISECNSRDDFSPAEKQFRVKILNHLAQQLLIKNSVDGHLLDRKEHIKANAEKLGLINEALTNLDAPIFPSISQNNNTAYTTSLKRNISEVNSHRLDMVWSRAFIETIIKLYGFAVPELKSLIAIIALVNGLASYGFYVVRGGADALPGLLHLFPHEKYDQINVTLWDRLAFQTEQRYQRIINDLVLWAPVNYITFRYWTGDGWLGFAGNLLTAVLLIGDYSLNCYVYYDKIRQYNKIIEDLETKFNGNPYFEEYKFALRSAHEKTLDNIKFETNYQIALVVAFILLWSPFCVNSMIFTVLGAAACFGLQLFINQRNMYLNYTQETCENQKQIMFYEGLNRLFVQLLIPSLYLVTGLFIMPMLPMVSAPVMFAFSTAVIATLVKLNDDFMALFKARNKKNPKLQEIDSSALKLQDDLIKLGIASSFTSVMVLSIVKMSLIGLNPALGLSISLGLMCYASLEYASSADKADSKLVLGVNS